MTKLNGVLSLCCSSPLQLVEREVDLRFVHQCIGCGEIVRADVPISLLAMDSVSTVPAGFCQRIYGSSSFYNYDEKLRVIRLRVDDRQSQDSFRIDDLLCDKRNLLPSSLPASSFAWPLPGCLHFNRKPVIIGRHATIAMSVTNMLSYAVRFQAMLVCQPYEGSEENSSEIAELVAESRKASPERDCYICTQKTSNPLLCNKCSGGV